MLGQDREITVTNAFSTPRGGDYQVILPTSFKHYIFGLLFYKRLCDVWDEEYEALLAEFDGDVLEAQKNYRAALALDPTYRVAQQNLHRTVSNWSEKHRGPGI